MKRVFDVRGAKHALSLVLALCSYQAAWAGVYQHGTVVRMRMGECLPVHHGFMMAMGGAPAQMGPEVCPEYTLISETIVFVIVGRSSDQLVPLADIVDFRISKNELAMRIDDARREGKFTIKEMILRSEWDVMQKHITDQMSAPTHATESSMTVRTRD